VGEHSKSEASAELKVALLRFIFSEGKYLKKKCIILVVNAIMKHLDTCSL
jgi:hypothetical protein